MTRMEASVMINRPVDEVFAYVADVGNWPQWNSAVLEGERTSTGPMGVGTTSQGVSRFLGRRTEWTSEVTEYEPNRKMGQKITSGPMSVEQSLTFELVEGATRLTFVAEVETAGFVKLADPILNRTMQGQMEGNLANLKDILEAQA